MTSVRSETTSDVAESTPVSGQGERHDGGGGGDHDHAEGGLVAEAVGDAVDQAARAPPLRVVIGHRPVAYPPPRAGKPAGARLSRRAG
jgi:hypothetical protein